MPLRRLTLPALLMALTGLVLSGASAVVAAQPSPPDGETVIALAATGVDRANTLAYSPDGRWLAAGTSTGLLLYDTQALAEARFIPTGTWVRSLAFSPDGELLATGSYDPSVRLWRVADGALVRELAGHTGWVRSVAFSPDGTALVSASDDDSVRVWRVDNGATLQVLTEGLDGVRAVAFSPDGATLATGGYDKVVRLWRAADGALLHELSGHTDWVRCLAFSPDGAVLASGGFDPAIRLWRVADGALLGRLAGHTASVLSLAFSPDGAALASGSVDTRVRLWRVADGAAVGLLAGHSDFVFAVAFAPDGQTLASGGVDNTLRLWAVGPIATAAPLPADADPADPANASCVTCHHPRGDVRRPGGLAQPARVVEVDCATCHTGGTLVQNWCPAFPRSPGASGLSPVTRTGAVAGVWHGSRETSLVLGAPGNGAHFYASYLLTALPVSGHLYSADADLSEVTVQLEIWTGAERIALATTRVQADGSFHFVTNLSPLGIPIEVPIEKRDCEMCHGHELRDAPALSTGEMRLVVTALGADGPIASDERWIVVDHGQMAAASVAVVSEEDGQPVAELPVQAAVRLYAWRGRSFAGTTGETGVAHVEVEALAAAETEYTFQVPPTLAGGQLYASVAPVRVTVPAGAESVAPLTLTVRAQTGQITGQVLGGPDPLTIHAIHLPDGARYDAQASGTGAFAFAGLPIGQYQVLAEAETLAAHDLASLPQTVDLAASPSAEVALTLSPLEEPRLEGVVLDEQGRPLPFAWIGTAPEGPARAASPIDGGWALAGLAETKSLVATAPGYYSQAVALSDQAALEPLTVRLSSRPDLERWPWGDGEILRPPETRATVDGQRIVLDAGWLWGAGGGAQPVTIQAAGATIVLTGAFALENVPGRTAWLYLFEGTADVSRAAEPSQSVRLEGGSMLALTPAGDLVGVPLDPVVIGALAPSAGQAPLPVWEPSPSAQLRDRLALLGVTTAQVMTFATYLLAVAALCALPIALAARWRRRGRAAHLR